MRERQRVCDLEILTMGISFTVYSDGENIDRAWPFDIIPRIIDGNEWSVVERGLAQRLRALNRFIDDVYNDQRIIADGVFPAELLADSANYRPECRASIRSSVCGRTSPVPISCEPATAGCTCSRTTCGCRPA